MAIAELGRKAQPENLNRIPQRVVGVNPAEKMPWYLWSHHDAAAAPFLPEFRERSTLVRRTNGKIKETYLDYPEFEDTFHAAYAQFCESIANTAEPQLW